LLWRRPDLISLALVAHLHAAAGLVGAPCVHAWLWLYHQEQE
jgi:hypothetical protein